MRNFQQKNGLFRKMLYSKPVLMFLGILLLFFAWSVISFVSKVRITGENRRVAENKVARLEQQKESLSLEIEKLKTEKGIEESIRERFPVAKEGEELVVILEDKDSGSDSLAEEKKGFFLWWLFKKWFE